MSEDVAGRIRRAILDRGPITFAEFMEHALYGPGGFYAEPPVGQEGHFVTAPHVHPVFAELVHRAFRGLWEALGRPRPFSVVEVGAGDGTLARDLLRLADGEPDRALAFGAVERSSGARARLTQLPIRVASHLEELGPLDPGVVFANELLDNLPFRRVRATPGGLAEVRVDVGANGLEEIEVPCDDDLAAWAPVLRPGQDATVPVEALRFVDELAGMLRHGYVLLVDYGSASGPAGDVHGYRDQRVFEDVLRDPGTADITAGVDFGSIMHRAEARGLRALGLVSQRDALLSLGFADWSEIQRGRQGRLLAEGAGDRAVRVWEGRSRASLLVDPAGLGRLRWLLLATPGLGRPSWIAAAQSTQDLRPSLPGSTDGERRH